MIKAGDLAHPTKPYSVHSKWSKRVVKEFYEQGDAERELGLPVSPLCDRKKGKSLAESQIGFISFCVLPMWNAFASYAKDSPLIDKCMTNVHLNLEQWKAEQLAEEDLN